MVASRVDQRSPTPLANGNPLKMQRTNGTIDVAAARAAMPQLQQTAPFASFSKTPGWPSQQGYGGEGQAPAAQQLPSWQSGTGLIHSTHSGAGQNAEQSGGAQFSAGQPEAPPPPPPPPPPESPPAAGWDAHGSAADHWEQRQAVEVQQGGTQHARLFQHEAGSARAQYWAMHRPPGG